MPVYGTSSDLNADPNRDDSKPAEISEGGGGRISPFDEEGVVRGGAATRVHVARCVRRGRGRNKNLTILLHLSHALFGPSSLKRESDCECECCAVLSSVMIVFSTNGNPTWHMKPCQPVFMGSYCHHHGKPRQRHGLVDARGNLWHTYEASRTLTFPRVRPARPA